MALFLVTVMCAQGWSLILVEDGQSRCTIVVPRENVQILKAAEDLQYHLRIMSGAEVPIVHDPNKVKGLGIYIDTKPLGAHVPGRSMDRQDLWPDGYVIEVIEFEGTTGLVLSSPRSEGVSHAVYGLLEDDLGCHWFTPGEIGMFIPKRRTVTIDIPGGRRIVKPDFEKRRPWYNGDAVMNLTLAENIDINKWYQRNRSGEPVGKTGHAWHHIFTREAMAAVDEDGDGVSDLAPFYDGKRHPEYGGLCMSHPKAVEIASQTFIQFFRSHPNYDYSTFMQPDSQDWCRCDRCLAMASNDGARQLILVNRIAENVTRVHPAKRIIFGAYKETLDPPRRFIPCHPNLIPTIVSMGVDQIGPKEQSSDFGKQVKRWMMMLPRAWSYDYIGATNGPWPLFDSIQKDYDFYRSVGYTGIMNEYLSRNMGTDIHMWLTFQMTWDARRRVKDLLNIFYPSYFGAAADDMRSIYEEIEQHMTALGGPAGLADAPQYYPAALLKRWLATLTRARQKVSGNTVINARLDRDENCLKATLLWVRYQDALATANTTRLDHDRAAATTACKTYLNFVSGMVGKTTMAGGARTRAERMLKSLEGPGTYFADPGLHYYWDAFAYGGKAFHAKSLSGFHFGSDGLLLKPGTIGELVYDFRAGDGLDFAKVSLPGGPGGWDLAIKMALPTGGRNKIQVSLDQGRTWTTAFENIKNIGKVHEFDLTRHLNGANQFLLKFWVQNTDREILALTCLVIEAHLDWTKRLQD